MKLYETLNINPDSSFSDIKSSYKNMAIKYHPDKNKDTNADKIFIDINYAYKILSDPDKRSAYDIIGDKFLENPKMSDLNNIFENIFCESTDVPDVDVYIELSLDELYTGCKLKKKIERYNLCNKCGGKGTFDGNDYPCKKCKGTGDYLKENNNEYIPIKCEDCDGNGIDLHVDKCTKCNGDTCYKESIKLDVDIPAGAYMGYTVVVKHEGNEIPKASINKSTIKRTNINFIVDEIKHNIYGRGIYFKNIDRYSRADLLLELEITLAESLCGFNKKINHISGEKINIVYKKTVLNNNYIVFKSKGMPVPHSDLYGDLFIKIKIKSQNLDSNIKNRIWQILMKESYPKICMLDHTEGIIDFDEFEKK